MKTRFLSPAAGIGSASAPGRPDGDFTCLHCHGLVTSNRLSAGVRHRNHCPYCLWSRHLDLFQAGDRLAACKAGMQPVGLTVKRTDKKYGPDRSGELMLIHICVGCGRPSINRIAADDHAATVFETYQRSLLMDSMTAGRLEACGIRALGAADLLLVRARLFGVS